mgnify:CR=1 FL=1
MSATISNVDMLARWLQAKLYQAEFRPAALYEHLVVGNSPYLKEDIDWEVRAIPVCVLSCLLYFFICVDPLSFIPFPWFGQRLMCKRGVSHRQSLPNFGFLRGCTVELVLDAASHGHNSLVICSSRKSCMEVCVCLFFFFQEQ